MSFGGGGSSFPAFMMPQLPAPVPVPTQQDPAVLDAARRQAAIEAGLSGRASTLLAGAVQTDPSARAGSRLLGNFGALGG